MIKKSINHKHIEEQYQKSNTIERIMSLPITNIAKIARMYECGFISFEECKNLKHKVLMEGEGSL